VSRSFIAIPPFPRSQFGLNAGEQYIITVDERLYAARDKQVLSMFGKQMNTKLKTL